MGFSVSAFLDTTSCLDALEMATGYRPTIINSDQGCQYTSQEWVYSFSILGIKISMDAVAILIIYPSSVFGERLNMKRFT